MGIKLFLNRLKDGLQQILVSDLVNQMWTREWLQFGYRSVLLDQLTNTVSPSLYTAQ